MEYMRFAEKCQLMLAQGATELGQNKKLFKAPDKTQKVIPLG